MRILAAKTRSLHNLTTALLAVVSAFAAVSPVQAQTFSVLYSFKGAADGGNPLGTLLLRGNLYGTASGPVSSKSNIFRLNVQGETVLYTFQPPFDGFDPNAGLIADPAGNLYGTTVGGGILGTVFQLSATGVETLIHNFTGPDGSDPYGGLVRDMDGNLYGTSGKAGTFGGGTVFKLDPAGNFTTLHQFGGPGDGAAPLASLLLLNGGLIGTTAAGGPHNSGTVFYLNLVTGTTTLLYNFTGGTDGFAPLCGLVEDGNGNLYGTTSYGGRPNGDLGNGVVFRLHVATRRLFVLHAFQGTDGALPSAGLLRDAQGNLYGTTVKGGAANLGTVFKLDPEGHLTTLHSFTGAPDGSAPYAGLVADPQGRLYGAASAGGEAGFGTIFAITP